ncbi:YrrS family protein [Virgibacillus xinjiangensis]|uniref:YrrS family protein n=1 Tax=Virgibacillus xinjiangensis TaxID=393090 RepID=A0ABV7CRU9_9BACI
MSSTETESGTRVNKFEKRRKNTKAISILLILGGILLLVLLSIWIFGGNGDQAAQDTNEQQSSDSGFIINDDEADKETADDGEGSSESQQEDEDQQSQDNASENESAEDNEDEKESDELEKEPADASDGNVKEAYTADWEPIGTEQEGEHTTVYEEGSQDRKEIAQAAAMATGLNAQEMKTVWVGNNNHPQKVRTTVATSDYSEIYRVFLTWVDGEGWKPTKVEELYEPAK